MVEVYVDGVKYIPEPNTLEMDELIKKIDSLQKHLKDQYTMHSVQMDKLKGVLGGEEEVLDNGIVLSPLSEATINSIIAEEDISLIYLRAGYYHQQIDLSKRINPIEIREYPHDSAPVVINGLTSVTWDWKDLGNNTFQADYPGFSQLWHHVDRRSMHNTVRAYPVLCTINDNPIMWNAEGAGALSDNEFYISSAPNLEGTITVKLFGGDSIDDFQISPFSYLLRAHEGINNCTLKGINFKGCSNTNFTGAISLPGSKWTLTDIGVSLANTIGIELGQGNERSNMRSQLKGSTLTGVRANMCGQMGWWGSAFDSTLWNCGHTKSNWKNFDTHWHAGHKFENMHECTLRNWYAIDSNGPGLWLDGVYLEDGGGNTGNSIIDPHIERCVRTGIELELGSSNNSITRGLITDIQNLPSPDPNVKWSQSAGIMIKGFSDRNIADEVTIKNCDRAVWIDNTDSRGPSHANKLDNISIDNIQDDPPYLLLGDANGNEVNFK